MGFSFRRSIKMGPLRLNLSTRGVGVSAGVRGARVSVGLRGTYVTLGRGGFQYRAKLSDTPKRRRGAFNDKTVQPDPVALRPLVSPPAPAPSGGEQQRTGPGYIHTATAGELIESSPENALQDLQAHLSKTNLFKVYLWVSAGLWLFSGFNPLIILVIAILAIPIYGWNRDRRTARIIYDVDQDEIVARLALANSVGEHLASTQALWHVFYSAPTMDWKRNAGAGTLLQRSGTRATPGTLPQVELNVEPYCVPIGPQQLLFLPDRLIVWDGTAVAGIAYERLQVEVRSTQFIEDGKLPKDGVQVGSTWRFPRKDGGPDMRFNDNRQIPIMNYGELTLRADAGLTVVLQTSTVKSAERAAKALEELRQRSLLPVSEPRTVEVTREPSASSMSPRILEAGRTRPSLPGSRPIAPASTLPTGDARLHSVAVLLRYMAAADRRISDSERAFLWGHGGSVLGREESAQLPLLFEQANTDVATVEDALARLSQEDLSYRQSFISLVEQLAGADGKVTPKEVERLREIRGRLG